MSDNSSENIGTANADILAILARVENDYPDIAAATLAHEVNSLLDRDSAPPKLPQPHDEESDKPNAEVPSLPLSLSTRGQVKRTSAFDWFQRIAAALPPVMSSEQTTTAAEAVEIGLLAQEKLGSLDYRSIANSDMNDLDTLIVEGRSAFRKLIVSNLRLVFHWSKGVTSSFGEDWAQDAFQAGCIGLIRGIQGWDYKKGYALSTYVSWHIRQQIQRWRWNEVSVIRLPAHVWEELDSNSSALSDSVKAAALQALDIISLDNVDPVDLEFVWDGGLEEITRRATLNRVVSQLFDDLTEREVEVLKLRFGFNDTTDMPMTLDNIGKKFGVTRERIRQIEAKAIDKIKEHDLQANLSDLF